MPPTGQPFGKYVLEDRIAAGGMAEVYRARYRAAAGVTKQVVIKKILPHYAGNQSFIRMFRDEAKLVVRLSHGNIAQVFDFDEIDGEYYLAMELVQGQALSKLIRRAREKSIPVIPTPFAVYIAMEMCKGLHYAHTLLDDNGRPLGIVHRDVSPQNVIISYDGQVKLVDFGIAKARTAGRNETEAGAIKGKYVYFAPEQARGRGVDARTDVFATGIVLYEMLCGRLPFEGKMMDVLSKIVRCDFPRPRSINPDITPGLERILLTAMAGDLNERYPSAQAFQEALAGYLYANAPTFSGAMLQQLMSYLYEPELIAEGRPVQISRDFMEQVPLWQKQLPAATGSDDASSRETTAGRASRRSRSRSRNEVETRAAEPSDPGLQSVRTADNWSAPSPLGPKAKTLLVAVPIAAAALAAGLMLAWGHLFASFSVQLTSSPPGANVFVDGAPAPQVTPVLISNLSANRPHLIEVTAPGMKRWSHTVQPARGATLPLHAELVPERLPEILAAPAEAAAPAGDEEQTGEIDTEAQAHAEPEAEPEAPKVTWEATYPVSTITLEPAHHTLVVPPTKAARIRLDPKKTYTVWAEGQASIGGYVDILHLNEAFYFLEGSPGLAADESFGKLVAGKKNARVIRNASALYAFVLDERPYDNSGAMKIRIQERGTRTTSTLLLDPRLAGIYPGPRQRFSLTGLSQGDVYEVTVRQGPTPARTRAGRSGTVRRIAYVQLTGQLMFMGRPTDEYAQVLEVGKTYRMLGTSFMNFFFLDDTLDDNEGSLIIEVAPAVGTGGAFETVLKGIGR